MNPRVESLRTQSVETKPYLSSERAELMTAFYNNRAAGKDDVQALTEAQRALRQNAQHPEWASPFYWAAFVPIGLAQ